MKIYIKKINVNLLDRDIYDDLRSNQCFIISMLSAKQICISNVLN